MKNNLFLYLVAIIIILGLFFLPSKIGYKSNHPTLNEVSQEPAYHLKNVGHYLKAEEMERSIYHLQRAIDAIKEIERDVDLDSNDRLDAAIAALEEVNDEFWSDTIDVERMYKAFEFTLTNLAHAELEVSEMYAETNQQALAGVAVKYAQMHIRNALLFQRGIYSEGSDQLVLGNHVFEELDSLLADETMSPMEISLKIDHIIKEVDMMLASK